MSEFAEHRRRERQEREARRRRRERRQLLDSVAKSHPESEANIDVSAAIEALRGLLSQQQTEPEESSAVSSQRIEINRVKPIRVSVNRAYVRDVYTKDNPRDVYAKEPSTAAELPKTLSGKADSPQVMTQRRTPEDATQPPSIFRGLRRSHILGRKLPANLSKAGFRVDEAFRTSGNINHVMRVVSPEGEKTYLKVESEGMHAHRSSILASLILARLNWAGNTRMVTESGDESVLIIPPVGAADIRDLGPFAECFPTRRETQASLDAPRAAVLARVRLEELQLGDDFDVLRFLVLNAAWANTDRHIANLHLGWRISSPDGRDAHGCLLAVDHGRCFFNSRPGQGISSLSDTPVDVVTGRGGGNPHQLLRPFAELVASRGLERVSFELTVWCRRVLEVLNELMNDSDGARFIDELLFMSERVRSITQDPEEFILQCIKVVK